MWQAYTKEGYDLALEKDKLPLAFPSTNFSGRQPWFNNQNDHDFVFDIIVKAEMSRKSTEAHNALSMTFFLGEMKFIGECAFRRSHFARSILPLTFFRGNRKTILEYNVAQTSNTSSPQTLDLVQSWLLECSRSHDKCCKLTASRSYFPTRVIDVGFGGERSMFLLIQAYYDLEGTQHATLSHCWGKMAPLRLTKCSFSDLK